MVQRVMVVFMSKRVRQHLAMIHLKWLTRRGGGEGGGRVNETKQNEWVDGEEIMVFLTLIQP